MGLGSGLFIRNSLRSGLAHAEVAFPHHLEEQVLNTATEALAFAKENASWSDRTGDARAELDVDVRWEGKVIVWEMYHGVDYGLYLETMQNGKFSVIMPTLELFAPEVGRGLRETGGNFD